MNKDLIASATRAISDATAPMATPAGIASTAWCWLTAHDIGWFVACSTLLLIWLQIIDRLRGKGRTR